MSVLPAEFPVAEPPVVLLVDSDSEKDETLAEAPAELPVAELPVVEFPVVLLVDSDSEKPDEMPTFVKDKNFKKPTFVRLPIFVRARAHTIEPSCGTCLPRSTVRVARSATRRWMPSSRALWKSSVTATSKGKFVLLAAIA